MFNHLLAGVAGVAVICGAATAQEAEVTLAIGDKAPQLENVEWIKGEAVSEFEEGQFYVLDFWATWCGPCVASIPHINKLQQDYKEKDVNVIGVAIWGSQDNEKFVNDRGDGMDYRVAVDMDDKTAEAYMTASGQGGIPTVMVVDSEGVIAWIGHPMDGLDETLEALVDEGMSTEELIEHNKKIEAEKAKLAERIAPLMQTLQQAFGAQDWPVVEKSMLEIIEIDPDYVSQFSSYVYAAKVKQGKQEDARKYAADLMSTAFEGNADAMNGFAWGIVAPDSMLTKEEVDAEVAIMVAEKAVELTDRENADILDTLARAYFVDGQISMAVETQREAVKKGDQREDYVERLEEYEAAAAES